MKHYGLSEDTAQGLRRLLSQSDLGNGRRGRASPSPIFVRCDSETAVGGNDVLDQCYPALILAPACHFPAPPEENFPCLLTVLGDDGEAVEPREGAVYLCLLTGEVESDRSGSGSSIISGRPRAFGVPVAPDTTWRLPVRVAAPSNITLSAPGASIDSVSMAAGDRFLAPNQSTASQNGLYVWNGAAVAATRTLDADSGTELSGAVVVVLEGTANSDTLWLCTTDSITIGATNITFVCIKPKALDNHALRQNGTDGIQTSRVVFSDASDVTAYSADNPSSSTPFARIGITSISSGTAPTLTLAPIGLPDPFTAADEAFTIIGEETGGHLSAVAFTTVGDGWIDETSISEHTLNFVTFAGWMFGDIGAGVLYIPHLSSYDLAYRGNGIQFMHGGGAGTFDYLFEASSGDTVRLRIRGPSALETGYTGTIGPNATATGGVVTGGGSGSYVTTGANTFTDTQTITSGNAPALVAQQTSNNASHTIEGKNVAGTVTFFVTGAGDVTATSYTGSGAGLTNLDASQLTTGTIPPARLPSGIGIGGGLALFLTSY